MPVRFSIVMTVFEPWEFLPRGLACVMQQAWSDWELLLVVDGPSPEGRFSPWRAADQIRRACPGRRIELFELPRAEGCWGNASRRYGLQQATGEYVCWVNHDNLIAPRYLAAHAENITKTPRCVSVVDIDLWQHDRYQGRYPRALRRSRIDLLNFAVPRDVALTGDAFGPAMERVYAADWLVFEACSKVLPVEHRRELVGTHF